MDIESWSWLTVEVPHQTRVDGHTDHTSRNTKHPRCRDITTFQHSGLTSMHEKHLLTFISYTQAISTSRTAAPCGLPKCRLFGGDRKWHKKCAGRYTEIETLRDSHAQHLLLMRLSLMSEGPSRCCDYRPVHRCSGWACSARGTSSIHTMAAPNHHKSQLLICLRYFTTSFSLLYRPPLPLLGKPIAVSILKRPQLLTDNNLIAREGNRFCLFRKTLTTPPPPNSRYQTSNYSLTFS